MRLLLAVVVSLVLSACVPQGKYDQAIADATTLRGTLQQTKDEAARRSAANDDARAKLESRIKELEDASNACDQKLSEFGTNNHNLQASLDEATAINQKLRAELERLGKDVDKVLKEKGTLVKSLDDAKVRLEELRKAQAAAEARAAVFQDFVRKLKKMVDSGQLKIVVRRGRLVLQLANDVLFDSGSPIVKPTGKATIRDVAAVLKTMTDRQFQVAGHTDNVPIGGGYASNWELSTERALHVLKLLVAGGVAAQQVSAAGYGEFDPIASNDDEDGRAKNRRIEITLQPNIEDLASIPDVK